MLALLLAPGLPLLAVPLPGQTSVQRIYCRMVLRCLGVRITVSGSPIRNLRGCAGGQSAHVLARRLRLGSVLPGSFVAKADMFTGPRVSRSLARLMNVIPIERANLRRLPGGGGHRRRRLRAGQTVVAFPEGTTWCGLAHGSF